ncbi:uracil-DNA glycosylase [Bacillus sp. 1P06AnD]|uniref:uracil-DNA glycosylase n=1 Tax=Bacillus sp. 1P06AnD TaxID=3132208 RepID=UPI0039A22E69
MNVKEKLHSFIENNEYELLLLDYFPNSEIDPTTIKAIMINEVVASIPEDDFYSSNLNSYYMSTVIPLFKNAGIEVETIQDILEQGIYITSAIKMPKGNELIKTDKIKKFLPILEKELDLFPNVKAIMLNGDIAKKAFNYISKKKYGKNAVPAGSTYKLRKSDIFIGDIKIFPAYILTGKNVLIEKSKFDMNIEDLKRMIKRIEAK